MLQRLVGDLRRATHLLRPEVASMVMSVDFENTMARAAGDDNVKAFLLAEALKVIALDPFTGWRAEDFYSVYTKEIGFGVRFHGVVNFVGLVTLPVGSAPAKLLIAAIENNLNGRLFKAAKMYRRLDRCRAALIEQVSTRASRAYAAVRMSCGGKFLSQEDLARAVDAYDRVYKRRLDAIHARIGGVNDAATPGFLGAFPATVGEFLYRNLPTAVC